LSRALACRIIRSVRTARLLLLVFPMGIILGCNRNQPAVLCAPLTNVTLVRVSQNQSGQPHQFEIDNRYRLRALMEFANGRREEFSARRKGVPAAITSATFYDGAQPLLTFGAGRNFFSLSCSSYAGVQEANRVQIAEFERLLTNQP
jgi:hypothetical protein